MSKRHYEFDSVNGVLRIDGRMDLSLDDGEAFSSADDVLEVSVIVRAASEAIIRARLGGEFIGREAALKTLRDEFAMAALAAMRFDGFMDGGCAVENYSEEGIARQAYMIADAMLAERVKVNTSEGGE